MNLILVVEDNPANMELVTTLLEEEGYDYLIARDGAAGLTMAYHEMPDLVLMDVSLPLLSGLDATGLLKREGRTQDIPIIALTAHAMSGDRRMCMDAGCDDYETKPIEASRLLAKMRKHIAKRPPEFVRLVEQARAKNKPKAEDKASSEALDAAIQERESLKLLLRQATASQQALEKRIGLLQKRNEQLQTRTAEASNDRELEAKLEATQNDLAEAREKIARSRRTSQMLLSRWKKEEQALKKRLAEAESRAALNGEDDVTESIALHTESSITALRADHEAELSALRHQFDNENRMSSEREGKTDTALRIAKRTIEELQSSKTRLQDELSRVRQTSNGANDMRFLQSELKRCRTDLTNARSALARLQQNIRSAVDASYQEAMFGNAANPTPNA